MNLLGPVALMLLNFKFGLAKTKYPELAITFYFINFKHALVLDKLGLKCSMVCVTGP